MPQPLRIIIAHENDYIQHSLSDIIRTNNTAILEAVALSNRELLGYAKTTMADIFIIDTSLLFFNETNIISDILILQPLADIIVFSDWKRPNLILRAKEFGAKGFVSVHGACADITNAIEALKNNKEFLCKISLKIMDQEEKEAYMQRRRSHKKLTEKEQKVIEYSGLGYSNKEIAVFMNISKRSVDDLKINIGFKTNTKKTIEMVRYVKENGLM